MQFSFLINASEKEKLYRCVDSIKKLSILKSNYEIIVNNFPNLIDGTEFCMKQDGDDLLAIRDRMAEQSRFENLVFCCDYVEFCEHWYAHWCTFDQEQQFQVATNPVLNSDGLRYWDWCIRDINDHCNVQYEFKDDGGIYIPIIYIVMKKFVWQKCHWSEAIKYKVHDLGYSKLLHEKLNIKFKFNKNSIVKLQYYIFHPQLRILIPEKRSINIDEVVATYTKIEEKKQQEKSLAEKMLIIDQQKKQIKTELINKSSQSKIYKNYACEPVISESKIAGIVINSENSLSQKAYDILKDFKFPVFLDKKSENIFPIITIDQKIIDSLSLGKRNAEQRLLTYINSLMKEKTKDILSSYMIIQKNNNFKTQYLKTIKTMIDWVEEFIIVIEDEEEISDILKTFPYGSHLTIINDILNIKTSSDISREENKAAEYIYTNWAWKLQVNETYRQEDIVKVMLDLIAFKDKYSAIDVDFVHYLDGKTKKDSDYKHAIRIYKLNEGRNCNDGRIIETAGNILKSKAICRCYELTAPSLKEEA